MYIYRSFFLFGIAFGHSWFYPIWENFQGVCLVALSPCCLAGDRRSMSAAPSWSSFQFATISFFVCGKRRIKSFPPMTFPTRWRLEIKTTKRLTVVSLWLSKCRDNKKPNFLSEWDDRRGLGNRIMPYISFVVIQSRRTIRGGISVANVLNTTFNRNWFVEECIFDNFVGQR